jgi:hypothetical protein
MPVSGSGNVLFVPVRAWMLGGMRSLVAIVKGKKKYVVFLRVENFTFKKKKNRKG